MTLARSGLISDINSTALGLLGYQDKEMRGKPFSLFIERQDMVIFYSHLNDLLSSFKKQSFELTLKHKKKESVFVRLECKTVQQPPEPDIHISFTEIADSRQASIQMQYQQDLLSLIYTVTNNISTASAKHFGQSIEDALKKICLFTQADQCLIYGINRPLKRLDLLYRWIQENPAGRQDPKTKHIPLERVKHTIVRLLKERSLVVDQVNQLPDLERQEVNAWHRTDANAVICHLIHSKKQPVAVINVVRNQADIEWDSDCIALAKFFGQFISDRLPTPTHRFEADSAKPAFKAEIVEPSIAPEPDRPNKVITLSSPRPARKKDIGAIPEGTPGVEERSVKGALPDMTRPMLLEGLNGRQIIDKQPVFARDDGLVLLTCPHCGCQESISVGQFDTLGNAIWVQCPCTQSFTAVLEKRRSFRKVVQLDGYFTLSGDLGAGKTEGSIWGPMVVKDLSKAGLRFSSKKADLVKPGDLLMVRFNLDNSNQALIHKPARVISSTSEEVGCQFEGSDSYDITLGFYFI